MKDDLAAVMGRSQGWSQKHHGPSCNFMSLALGCVSSFIGGGGGAGGILLQLANQQEASSEQAYCGRGLALSCFA